MQDKLKGIENAPPVTERRTCARFRVTSLMYIDIGNVNGGIVTSLSENGLALTAAASLGTSALGEGPLEMRFQIPGIPEAIEASGQIAWTSSSGKEACVRFLELGEKARDQIRNWVSAQASGNGVRPDPKLPKMRLPNEPAAKTRGPRFSFADVASSRVDAQGETGVHDFPEIAHKPDGFPPLEAGVASFRDGAEAVAAVFESPAFTTDDQRRKPRSPSNGQTTRGTSDQNTQRPLPSVSERRQHARREILLFTYAVLGDENGGIVFNLGEGGLALTAAAVLHEQRFEKIRLRFPDSEDWIETSGRLAWQSDSGKEAGIQLLSLPEQARARIREWVSEAEPAPDLRSRENESRVQTLPSVTESAGLSEEPAEAPAFFEEPPFEDRPFEERRPNDEARAPAAPSSALFKTGIKGVLERTSVRRRVAKIKPPGLPDHSEKAQTHVLHNALSIAAGVALALGGWMFLQWNSTNKASGIVAQNIPNIQPSQEPAPKSATTTQAGAIEPATNPPVRPSETAAPQTPQTDSAVSPVEQSQNVSRSPQKSETPVTSLNSGIERGAREKPHREEALARLQAAISPRTLDRGHQANTQREQDTRSAQSAALAARPSGNTSGDKKSFDSKPVERKPPESKPVEAAQALTPPSFSSSAPPAAAPISLGKEKQPEAPKQPEPVVTRTPSVTVSFDPYPSIRMPKAEKSKKSQQGKSLQMGRLLARVDPVYPEEARQQGIEGTARVHAIFNRDGSAQSVISLGGPPMLVTAAIKAVQQWHYSQTILGGKAMETEEDVTLQFRLANTGPKN